MCILCICHLTFFLSSTGGSEPRIENNARHIGLVVAVQNNNKVGTARKQYQSNHQCSKYVGWWIVHFIQFSTPAAVGGHGGIYGGHA